jgi:hypothetical protein
MDATEGRPAFRAEDVLSFFVAMRTTIAEIEKAFEMSSRR